MGAQRGLIPSVIECAALVLVSLGGTLLLTSAAAHAQPGGWVLWLTQQESRPHLRMPSHWTMLGRFGSERACEAAGQGFTDQLGRLSPAAGYTRATAALAFLDTSDDGRHETQTTFYCIAETVDPRGPKGR